MTQAVDIETDAVTLTRTMDATCLNVVANDPAVRPWLGGPDGPIDLSPLVSSPLNITLMTAHGGFVFVKLAPELYEVHSLFLPRGRGRHVFEAMQWARAYMFTATDCRELVTRVPATNKGAAALAKLAGFTPQFSRAQAWPVEGGPHGVSYHSLTLQQWALASHETRMAGAAFHARLAQAKHDTDSSREIHADDEAHDRMVGAAALMCFEGNPFKALEVYNRWALVAGYQPGTLISATPIVVDVVDAVVHIRNRQIEVLVCR